MMTSQERPLYLDQASDFLFGTQLSDIDELARRRASAIFAAVSYTHLTLPTKRIE